MSYTDLCNKGLDDLTVTLATISGLRVVTNPKDVNPPCILINAPTIIPLNFNIVKMEFPVDVLTLGPASLDALRSILVIVSALISKNVAVTDARPSTFEEGTQSYPCYRVTIPIQAQTG